MPASPIKTTDRSVLLVEEYDALAVAIQSALQKFAPAHRVQAVPSLAEARAIAQAEKPELIIVDFDPPLAGAIAFFEELRTVLPGSRVLIIAAGISKDLLAERGSENALQFLEKPFELVDFGAAVQALLGPWMETGTSRGTLERFGASDVAALGCLGGANTVIQLRDATNRIGQIHLYTGHMVHAVTGDREGESALVEMLTWTQVRFTESNRPTGAPRTMQGPWNATLLRSLREAKRLRPPAPKPVPPAVSVVPAPVEKMGPKVVVIDDTDMLLIFVEDSLSLADPTLRISTALTGLQGIKEVTRVQPDLVLLDYSLPDLNGDEVARRLLARSETARIPIVMMSGQVPEMTAAAAKLPNVIAAIGKPFRSEALMELVRQSLRKGPLPKLPPPQPAKAPAPPVDGPTEAPVKSPPAKPERPKSRTAREPEKFAPADEAPPPPPAPVARPSSSKPIQAPPPPQLVPAKPLPVTQPLPVAPPPLPVSKIAPIAKFEPPPVPAVTESTSADQISSSLSPNEILLDLPLDVVAMQFNNVLQIGSIRARPASSMVALEIPALAARAALPVQTGFQLGPIELDPNGRISTVRLIPTTQPFRAVETRSAFNIGGVTVVPANEKERLQLMASANAAMTMQLFAPLELVSLELNANLEVTQLVLRCRSNAVRVTLNTANSETQSGASFQTIGVQLDESRRIRELTLAPIAA